MGLKAARRMANTIGIVCIILGMCDVLVELAVAAVVAYLGVEGETSVLAELAGLVGVSFWVAFAFAALLAAAMVVVGVLAVRAARRPSRARRLLVAAIATLALAACGIALDFIALLQGSGSMGLLVSALYLALAAALAAIARRLVTLDEQRKEEGLPEEDPLKSDQYLGTLRVLEVFFSLFILFTLVGLIFTSRNAVVYDFGNLLDWANVVFYSMALWMIVRRYAAVRPFTLAFSAFNIVSAAVYAAATGTLSIAGQVIASGFDVFLFVYFLTSRRVRNLCVRKFHFGPVEDGYEKPRGILDLRRKGWPMVRNLVMYYCVFSLMGHWMEAAMCQLIRLGLVQGGYDPTNTMLWRDWFYPFPMEGLAVVLIALFLYPLKNWLVEKIQLPVVPYAASFFANMMVCVCIEFFMGLVVNAHYELWDYRTMPFNFMGQVCLQNSLAFGAAASVIAWVVYPLLDRALSKVPNDAMNIAFVVCVAAYAIPQTLYLIDPPEGLEQAVDVYVGEDGAAGSS